MNQGCSATEATASSRRGWDLMKLSVASGKSLEVRYPEAWPTPAQLPGLQKRDPKGDRRREGGGRACQRQISRLLRNVASRR